MPDALVHEWLETRGGAEQVFKSIARCMPNAEIVALSAEPAARNLIENRDLRTTFLDYQLLRGRRSLTLPLMPTAWWISARKRSYDNVVISHHSLALQFARHCKASRRLAYVHAPARYLWSPDLDGRGSSPLLMPVRSHLKRVDLKAVEHIDFFAANSKEVAKRIQSFWHRQAVIIHPPVDTDFFSDIKEDGQSHCSYILGFSRFIPYKRLDLVIETGELLDMPVVIAGDGPDESTLRKKAASARVPVTFVIQPNNERLRDLYQHAACLVFPAHEDFGIVPIEAQATGTPVVGVRHGGILETVIHGESGILVDEQSAAALAQGARDAFSLSPAACRQNALRFSTQRFERELSDWIARS